MEKFNVILTEVGPSKIRTAKAIKEACDLSLSEAAYIINNIPSFLKKGLSKNEAEDLKKTIEEVGGKVNIESFEDLIFNNEAALKKLHEERLQDKRLKTRVEIAVRIGMAVIEAIEKDDKITIHY